MTQQEKMVEVKTKKSKKDWLQIFFGFLFLVFLGIILVDDFASTRNSIPEQKIEKKSKKQEYEEMYGEILYAELLYKKFKENPISMNKICEGKQLQMEGTVFEMGSDSDGNYIDLYTNKEYLENKNKVYPEKFGNIRIFLANSEWNNDAIMKIKRKNIIVIEGICYGQTEAFGIKSKIIIGNATILKVSGKFL